MLCQLPSVLWYVFLLSTYYFRNNALLADRTNNLSDLYIFIVTAWLYASCADMEV